MVKTLQYLPVEECGRVEVEVLCKCTFQCTFHHCWFVMCSFIYSHLTLWNSFYIHSSISRLFPHTSGLIFHKVVTLINLKKCVIFLSSDKFLADTFLPAKCWEWTESARFSSDVILPILSDPCMKEQQSSRWSECTERRLFTSVCRN